MKLFRFLFISFLFLITACNKEENTPIDIDSFIFGQYCNYCVGDCAQFYKLDAENIYVDEQIERFARVGDLHFNNTLPKEKFDLAKSLIENFPLEILEEKEIIGLPDAHDQCGLFIAYKKGDIQKHWYIDTIEDRLPEYLQTYTREVKNVIHTLQE